MHATMSDSGCTDAGAPTSRLTVYLSVTRKLPNRLATSGTTGRRDLFVSPLLLSDRPRCTGDSSTACSCTLPGTNQPASHLASYPPHGCIARCVQRLRIERPSLDPVTRWLQSVHPSARRSPADWQTSSERDAAEASASAGRGNTAPAHRAMRCGWRGRVGQPCARAARVNLPAPRGIFGWDFEGVT